MFRMTFRSSSHSSDFFIVLCYETLYKLFSCRTNSKQNKSHFLVSKLAVSIKIGKILKQDF